MAFDLIIRGGSLCSGDGVYEADIAIEGGKIRAVGAVDGPAKETFDATGLAILPGVIDTQVHFREPGLEHKEDLATGTMAAIAGGVTTVFEMPNTIPTTSTKSALDDKLRRCMGRAWCDHAFFIGATTENIDELENLERLQGTPGIKIFMGSSTGSLLVADDDHLKKVLAAGRRRCPIHAEDEERNRERKTLLSRFPHPREHPFLRDAESARLATERILRLSAETGRPVHILHVSTRDELPLIEDAKRKGLGTTAEVTPQHLFFSAPDCYDRLGSLAQMNPPIRSIEHQEGLWDAVRHGLFDVFGSDHAPHTFEEKSKPYPQSPSGMPGVQTMLPVLLDFASKGRLSLRDIARMACENPAKIYGIQSKGFIKPGFDADLAFVDPQKSWKVTAGDMLSKCGWTPYEGVELTGKVVHTMLRGSFAMRDGEVCGMASGKPAAFDWK